MAAPRHVVDSATAGFLSLFSASLVAKAVTFASNVAVARTVGRAMLGVGTLQLDELLFLGPLVMTRDGLRKVAYRIDGGGPDSAQSLVNLCWTTAPAALLLGLVGARSLWSTRSPPAAPGGGDGHFMRAIMYTLLALILAVIHEPAFLLTQSRMDQRFRARCETLAVLAKCTVMTVGTVVLVGGIEAFALGNVAYAGTLCALYLGEFYSNRIAGTPSLVPQRTSRNDWWDDTTFGPAKEFWVQSLQKWVLENGEKVAMVFLGTDEQAGEYVLISNLGSIVARLLFQPLEEMALATFGKLQAIVADPGTAQEQRLNAQRTMRQAFSVLIRLLTLLGLGFACFGPAYAHLLLHLLYGSSWSATTAPRVLAWYCPYIMAMAVNGLCEAFVQGATTQAQLRTYNYWMVLFSVCFLCAVVLLMPYGAVGIVAANILKMLCRIAVCVLAYIRPAFDQNGNSFLAATLPAPEVIGMFAGAAAITQASSAYVYRAAGASIVRASAVRHVAVGCACLGVVAYATWRRHGRQLVRDVAELRGR